LRLKRAAFIISTQNHKPYALEIAYFSSMIPYVKWGCIPAMTASTVGIALDHGGFDIVEQDFLTDCAEELARLFNTTQPVIW